MVTRTDNQSAPFVPFITRALTEALKLSLFLAFWMLAQAAAAQVSNESRETEYGLYLHAQEAGDHWPAPVLSTQVDMHVTGPILRATVTQRFANPAQVWVEARYNYPLPDTAVVDAFQMQVGDRIIEGQVQEKSQAKKRYQKARKNGQRASLLQQHQGNRFSTRVANIPPGEQIEVRFECQQILDFQDHGYQLRLPIVETPSYVPNGAVPDAEHQSFATRYQKAGSPNRNPVGITLELEAGFPVSQVLSRSHPIRQEMLNSSHYRVTLAPDADLSDRDFSLEWRYAAENNPQVKVFRQSDELGEFGMVMVLPPAHSGAAESVGARELVLVLDKSGSMQGESIRQARSAALDALDGLESHDFFNLVLFSQRAQRLFPDSRLATPETLRYARNTIQGLTAGGGTEMRSALELALTPGNEPERLRQVVFITDGAVTQEDQLFELIDQRLGASRLFTVGIGSAPNHYFMRRAAEAGRGIFTYVSRPEDVHRKMQSLLRRLQTPALTNLSLNWEGEVKEAFPSQLPDLYLGQALVMLFRTDAFPGAVTLSGKRLGRDEIKRLQLNSRRSGKGLRIEWARRKLAEQQARYARADKAQKQKLKQEIVSLALDHQVVTPFTSFVAVDATPVRAGGALESKTIRSNLPKGWAHDTVRQSRPIMLAQTANGARGYLLWGSIALLLALWLWRLGLRSIRRHGEPQHVI